MNRRRRDDRGAAAVEAAIVTPMVLLLMLGILEFGMFFKNSLSASEAAKAGVRIASATPRNTGYAQKAVDRVTQASGGLDKGTVQALWVYKANATNNFPAGYSSFAGCTTCVRYAWTGTAFTPTYDNWPAASQDACAASPPDRIGVYLQVRHNAISRLVLDGVTIHQSDVLRFEPLPKNAGCRP